MRRRHFSRGQTEVELNLASMLDMAFQLLAFFVLTFHPSPIEGQLSLHLPPAVPVTNVATVENRHGPVDGCRRDDRQNARNQRVCREAKAT